MTEQHPITPPSELVQQWDGHGKSLSDAAQILATQAARWGADQELEACCEWLFSNRWDQAANELHTARRPKPLSLKEQALKAIGVPAKIGEARVIEHREHELIRRALQQLPD